MCRNLVYDLRGKKIKILIKKVINRKIVWKSADYIETLK